MKQSLIQRLRTLAGLSLALSATLLTSQSFAAGTISVDELATQVKAGKAPIIIDVRSEDEFLAGHLPNARLIPHTQIGDYVEGLSAQKDETIVLYCQSGTRADTAAGVLEKAGFKKVTILDGSYKAWTAAGNKVVK